ncbi:MAG: hypothetical protein JNK02_16690 [Planctomycetes bacterium]|nr:hypothetical protein [Planctomycetota bacterium]
MKRVALFLLLLGIGFTILWFSRDEQARRVDEATVEPPPHAGQFTEIPITGRDGATGRTVGIELDGELVLTLFGGSGPVLRPALELRASDVDSLGADLYDLKDVEIELLDPDSGVRRASLVAPLARVSMSYDPATPGASALRSARFTDVDATLHEGAPVVPLRLRSKSMDLDVAQIGLTTDEHVLIEGRGLEAEGAGLRAGFGQDRLELQRDAVVRLDLPGGERAVLASGAGGSLVVERRQEGGIDTLDVAAREGARLQIEPGPRAPELSEVTIEGREIRLVGRGPAPAREGYELVSANALGAVVAVSGNDEFRAQAADFAFGERGRLRLATLEDDVAMVREGDTFRARTAVFEFGTDGLLAAATLTGEPSGDVGIGRFLAAERPDLVDRRASIAGAGPLVVKLAEGVDVALSGPARVVVPGTDLVVTAATSLVGRVRADRRGGELHALGDAAIDYEGSTLRSPSVDLFWRLDAAGELALDAVSSGDTRLTGATEDGRPVTLEARGGLEAQWAGRRLLVPAAQGVNFAVGADDDPERIRATAQRVTGLDWEARTFTAEGDVRFRHADGEGDAERALVRGERDVELTGTETQRASYRLARSQRAPQDDVRVETLGRAIRATERRVTGRGDVRVEAEARGGLLELEAQEVDVDVAPEREGSREPRPFRFEARRDVRSKLSRLGETAELEAQWVRVDGQLILRPDEEPPLSVEFSSIEARGQVHAVWAGAPGRGALDARADRFIVDGEGRGRLSAGAGRRVTARGVLPGALAAYALSADWIDFDPDSIRASRVEGGVADRESPAAARALLRDLRANSLQADRGRVLLEGDAYIAGSSLQGESWSLSAGSIRVQGDFTDPAAIDADRVRNLVAQGGFEARMGSRGIARGERLEGVPGQVRLEGRPASLAVLDAEWRAPWIEYDMTNMLLATDRGEIASRPGAEGTSWSLAYDSMQPFDQGDATILVLRNPRLRYGSTQLFADWSLFWVDRDEWQRSGRQAIRDSTSGTDLLVRPTDDPASQADGARQPRNKWEALLEQARQSQIFRLLSEVYIEGNVEVYQIGDRTARAGAMYFDLVGEHGWIQDADVVVDLDLRGQPRPVRAKAEWMRISAGPSLRADTAVLTSCEYDEPHFVVETTDLRLTPEINAGDERVAFQVTAEGNAIRFENGLRVPLPPLFYETDAEGNPLVDRFVLGDSAKFGAAIGASINTQLGGIGLAMGNLARFAIGMPDIPIKGGWNFDVRYLGSRGLLLGAGLDLRLGDKLALTVEGDVIPDRRDDSGLVRVDRDDRELLRTWLHSRGRYWVERGDDAEWVDLAFSYQTDPGVQSEFFERRYLEYEEKDNYLHWRKARDSDYFSGSVKVLLEDRTDTAELPSLGWLRGRTEVATWWDNPVYHTGTVDAAYLERREGDVRYYDPYPDGLGDREVLRADTRQRIEMPFDTRVLKGIATPYVEARGSVWSEGVDEGESPVRAALLAGVEATTTLWRRSTGGTIHTLSPSIGLRGDLVDAESGGPPVRFDATEDPYLGKFVDAGVRARWWRPDAPDRLDIEVRTSIGDDVEGPTPDGLQPIAFLGGYYTILGGFPFAVTHDGRYDARESETQYSMTAMGFEPLRNVGIEFGHHYGRDALDETLYEAASARARWRWTTKWELEFRQTQSLSENRSLDSDFLLRRLGHDFVFEIGLAYRAGEGGSIGFGFEPRLAWRRSSLGLIDQWLGVYH